MNRTKSLLVVVAYIVFVVFFIGRSMNGGEHGATSEHETAAVGHETTGTDHEAPEADHHTGTPEADPDTHGEEAADATAHEADVAVEHEPEVDPFANKPAPEKALEMLKSGNANFVAGSLTHPHLDAERLAQAGTENQGDHAYATVITCSDSRVPVEAIFDAGIMDLFVIRVAGNVCDTDEAGSIEYGLAHVNTPVFVVLGHTQCGAVTAVTQGVLGHGHALEANIPPLVDNIEPAVKRAMVKYPAVKGEAIIPHAIEENVWQGMEDLFKKSPATRSLVKRGKVKVVGAIYDVGTGKVNWLPEATTEEVLHIVESGSNLMVEQIRKNAEHSAMKTIGALTSTALSVEEVQKNAEAYYNSVIEGLKAE